MKKNALLTFIFACIPGAGQMYYGYMQRGLSLITLFCACFILGALASPLAVTCFIVWMYSFFDTYDLIRHLAAGDPKADGLMLLGDWSDLKRLIPKHNRLLGWGLVDTWRQANPDNHEHFSWFDYRSKGFDDNRGLRIDLLLASQPLAQRCVETGIDYEIRGMEKPSDHAPVWATFRP